MGADVTFGSTLGGSLRQGAIAAAGSSSPSRKKEHSAERPAQRARVQRLARAPADRGFGVVAMAASAGGLRVLGALPSDFRVPTVVVQHLDPHHRSLMAEILGRRTPLHVKQPADREGLPPATVYIAPPDQHLLVNPDHSVSLAHSDLVRFLRPSADPLFESVAVSFGDRAIAVVSPAPAPTPRREPGRSRGMAEP